MWSSYMYNEYTSTYIIQIYFNYKVYNETGKKI